jgi:hypothetical protein
MSLFTKATKAQAKARVAFCGPSGAGKTYWSLLWAKKLADGGKIAFIDTERSSASLYADKFDFDTLSMSPPYHPDRLIDAIKNAEAEGYAVIVIDSLTHFWQGKGGVLEIVDEAKGRFGGNQYMAWGVGTPLQQAMVDALLAFNGHVIVTMRSKTEYTMEKNDKGKTEIKKVGMAPQQRDGIEYEFTLVFDVDIQHRAVASKTRCDTLADRSFQPNAAEEASDIFLTWLTAGDPLLTQNERDAIDNRIKSLTPAQRRALGAEWARLGLPKVNAMTEGRHAEALALVASADTMVEETSDEEVPA